MSDSSLTKAGGVLCEVARKYNAVALPLAIALGGITAALHTVDYLLSKFDPRTTSKHKDIVDAVGEGGKVGLAVYFWPVTTALALWRGSDLQQGQ